MSLLTVRPATAEDYPAVADVLTAAQPRRPVSAQALRASADKARSHPRELHLAQWVAVVDGAVVGFAGASQWAGSFHPDRYHVQVAVTPPRRGQGVGTALADTVRAHLLQRRAGEVLAGAYEDEPPALALLTGRDFVEVSREFDNVLALADFRADAWAAQATLPAGYRRLSLNELRAEQGDESALEAVRACFNAARADEPRTIPAQPYSAQEFRDYVAHPSALPGGIQLAVTAGGEVAALSELWRDLSAPARLDTGLTGTLAAHRRRGLALALKLAGLDVAARAGAAEVWTQNDSTNAPMLALNSRLGFVPQPAHIEFRWGHL